MTPTSMRLLIFAVTTALLAGGAAGSEPDSTVTTESPRGLSVTLTPFSGWAVGVDGTIAGRNKAVSADVSASPIDVLENLDVFDSIYFGWGEIRYRRFGLFFDVVHAKLSSVRSIDRRVVSGDLDVELSQTTGTIAGSYRVWKDSRGHLDAMAGVRITDIEARVAVDFRLLALERSTGDTWTDAIVGIKGQYILDPKWSFTGWGLIGGGSSDVTWDLYGALTYAVRPGFDLSGGFRGLKIDYSSDDLTWDMLEYGPVVNATFKF